MGFVRFKINERLQRICLWINQSFLLPADIDVQNSETDSFDFFKIPLVCIRDNTPLELTFYNDNTIQITTDDIELAGNLIQSMSQFLNVTNLNVSLLGFWVNFRLTYLFIDSLQPISQQWFQRCVNFSINWTACRSPTKSLKRIHRWRWIWPKNMWFELKMPELVIRE